MTRPSRVLPLIVLAQLLGTASWFAGNAVLPSLISEWGLNDQALAWVTNSVQLGFIIGALVFALLSLADRLSPSRLFFLCALLSFVANLVTALWVGDLLWLLVMRFSAGFLLAGIYPVGMKIAASWFPEGLGRALGYLVGALVLGTAAPHLFASANLESWQLVMYLVAAVNLASAFIILGVGDGPSMGKPAALRLGLAKELFSLPKLRCSALGYFGHMWELYAIWTIAPLWISQWALYQGVDINVSLMSFIVIAIGALGCALGGLWSQTRGSAFVASKMLTLSGLCCLLSPLVFQLNFYWVALFWLVWGFSIVADSPQFSTLSAQNSPADAVGTSLTLINSIGFTLTLVSVQLLVMLIQWIPVYWAVWFLLPGPILGVLAMRSLQTAQQ